MSIPNLVLPIFAVIVTGWLAGALGYVPRALAVPRVQFAYNIAMPALMFLTIAQEPMQKLLDWRFIAAFGGGTILCFLIVFAVARLGLRRGLGASAMAGTAVAIGLGFSFDELRNGFGETALLAAFKLVVTPLVVYGLCRVLGLDPFYTVAAVVCAAVPTAKTAYSLAGEYKVEATTVASTISVSTVASVATLLGWLYLLS